MLAGTFSYLKDPKSPKSLPFFFTLVWCLCNDLHKTITRTVIWIQAKLKEVASLDGHVLLKKLRDALECLKGRLAGQNKEDVEKAISMVSFWFYAMLLFQYRFYAP